MIAFGIAVVYCLHGDEILGKRLAGKLKNLYPSILFLEGNPKAVELKQRYIDQDLNRIFPGKKYGSYEERRAHSILNELEGFDIILDIHQTNTQSDPFVIITKKDDMTTKVVNSIPLDKIVFMSENIAEGKALIDHVDCSASIEFPINIPDFLAFNIVQQTIDNLISGKKCNNKKLFHALSRIEKEPSMDFLDISNFSLVKKGTAIARSSAGYMLCGEDFYPVFYGEKSFQNFLCLKAEYIGDFQ